MLKLVSMKTYYLHICGYGPLTVKADSLEISDGYMTFRLKSGKMVSLTPVNRTVIEKIVDEN